MAELARLDWKVDGRGGLEVKLMSLHCAIVWGVDGEQRTLDQQRDLVKNDVVAWVWTEQAWPSTVFEEWKRCEMQWDTEDES